MYICTPLNRFFIRWLAPPDPNERVVNYMLSRSPDATPSNAFIRCVSLDEITRSRDDEGREVRRYIHS